MNLERRYSFEAINDDRIPMTEAGRRIPFDTIDDVLTSINPYGHFQWMVNALLSVAFGAAVIPVILPYFLSIPPTWECVANSTICHYNSTVNLTESERCNLPRSEWTYTDPVEFSFISQFDLVCGRAWLDQMSVLSLFIGWAIGGMFFGTIADRYGRKVVVLPNIGLILIITMASTLSPNMWIFLTSRFIVGVLINGVSPTAFILMGEFVDTKHRPLATTIISLAHVFTWLVLALQAYYIRRWKYLVITCMAPYTLIIAFYKFLPESIHWLHSQGLKEDLNYILKRMAHLNRVILPSNVCGNIKMSERDRHGSGLKDIFIHPVLLTRTINLSFGWITASMVYYGLSLGADNIGGSAYLNFVFITVIDLPATILVMYASKYLGRKPANCSSMVLAGVFCSLVAFIPISGNGTTIRLALGVLAKLFVTAAYNSLSIWSFEIYPTRNRASGVGFLWIMGRIGGGIAPWVVKGLNEINYILPFVAMGVPAIISSLTLLLLPETKHLATNEMGRIDRGDYDEMDA